MEKTKAFTDWLREIKTKGTPAKQMADQKKMADQKRKAEAIQAEQRQKDDEAMNVMIATCCCGVAACL